MLSEFFAALSSVIPDVPRKNRKRLRKLLAEYMWIEAYSWGVGEDESRDGLYCGFEGVVGATVIGV